MEKFTPADNPRAFRTALGRFATGVTVITALENGVPVGITANSFASLSLEPALVLWSPAKASARHDTFVNADVFNVHVLADDQRTVCDAFVRDKHGFAGLKTAPSVHGVPVLAGCLAVFECKKHALYDAGDHTLILGHVTHCSAHDGAPLIFLNGRFIAPDEE